MPSLAEEVPLSAPIEKKIAWAQDRFKELKDHLVQSQVIFDLTERLKHTVHISHEKMTGSGIARLCRECERDEGGSCCGSGLENRYDGWLVLINLLLEAELPKERFDPHSCFFLGESGCLLNARHVICVNYVCKKITDRIDPRQLETLREKEGEELETLFLLQEEVKKTVRALTRSLDRERNAAIQR